MATEAAAFMSRLPKAKRQQRLAAAAERAAQIANGEDVTAFDALASEDRLAWLNFSQIAGGNGLWVRKVCW